jgi:hypothetical protein
MSGIPSSHSRKRYNQEETGSKPSQKPRTSYAQPQHQQRPHTAQSDRSQSARPQSGLQGIISEELQNIINIWVKILLQTVFCDLQGFKNSLLDLSSNESLFLAKCKTRETVLDAGCNEPYLIDTFRAATDAVNATIVFFSKPLEKTKAAEIASFYENTIGKINDDEFTYGKIATECKSKKDEFTEIVKGVAGTKGVSDKTAVDAFANANVAVANTVVVTTNADSDNADNERDKLDTRAFNNIFLKQLKNKLNVNNEILSCFKRLPVQSGDLQMPDQSGDLDAIIKNMSRFKSTEIAKKVADMLNMRNSTKPFASLNVDSQDYLIKYTKFLNTVYNKFLCSIVKIINDLHEQGVDKIPIIYRIHTIIQGIENCNDITGVFYQFQEITELKSLTELLENPKENRYSLAPINDSFKENFIVKELLQRLTMRPSYINKIGEALSQTYVEQKNQFEKRYTYYDKLNIELVNNYKILVTSYSNEIFCKKGDIDDEYKATFLSEIIAIYNLQDIDKFREKFKELFKSNIEFLLWSCDNGNKICYSVSNTQILTLCKKSINFLDKDTSTYRVYMMSKYSDYEGGFRKKSKKNSKDAKSKSKTVAKAKKSKAQTKKPKPKKEAKEAKARKLFTGPKGGQYYIVKKDGKSVKKYVKASKKIN